MTVKSPNDVIVASVKERVTASGFYKRSVFLLAFMIEHDITLFGISVVLLVLRMKEIL